MHELQTNIDLQNLANIDFWNIRSKTCALPHLVECLIERKNLHGQVANAGAWIWSIFPDRSRVGKRCRVRDLAEHR